jgi:peroxiredoxin
VNDGPQSTTSGALPTFATICHTSLGGCHGRPRRRSLFDIILLVGLLLTIAMLVLLFMNVYQLLLQNGRILGRLEEVERGRPWDDARIGVEQYVPTLPRGVPAPDIRLNDLNGVERRLSEWRGQGVLLVFMDPACVFSRTLLPSLTALTHDVIPGRPVPVVVSTGGLDENRRLFDGANFPNAVLLQEATEVAGAYKVDGTPMAYLVDADGTIASDIAVGIQAILIAAGEMGPVTDATATDHGARGAPALDETAKMRDGLPEGAIAPLFRLPRLDGGEISLLDYRGRNVVVVFSDPDCPPCDELAPQLEAVHRRLPGLAIVMISRGDAAETRAKAAEFGLTFPIGLQRHWEVSREYGIFANPAAFFVDEWGTIGANVAVGPDPIMALVHDVEHGIGPES